VRIGAIYRAVLVSCALVARAHAQTAECDDTSVQGVAPLDLIPGDGATAVTRDATLIARYGADADLDGLLQMLAQAAGDDACAHAPVCLFRAGADAGAAAHEPVPGRIERLDAHSIAFVPDALLAASSRYIAAVARPGFDSASRTEIAFETGRDVDREAPRFAASASDVDLEVDTPPQECAAPPGSLRVRLSVPRASDDGDEQSVRILVYLTRAAGLDAPLLRARVQNSQQGRVQLRFLLTPEQARSPVCIELQAIDGAGKLAAGPSQLCFDPAARSHFAGCGIIGGGARGGTMAGRAASLVPWCAVLALRRRRRRQAGTRIA
jgi:hypothetical protein